MKQPIRAKLPHFQLDMDVDLMTLADQKEAIALLKDSVSRLMNSGKKKAAR